jgi:hypothetical protein
MTSFIAPYVLRPTHTWTKALCFFHRQWRTQKDRQEVTKSSNSETTEATALSETMADTENTTGTKASDEASMMNGDTKSAEAPAVTPIGSEDVPMTEKKSDDEGTAAKDTTTASALTVSGGADTAAGATTPLAVSTTTASASRETDDALATSKDPSDEDFVDEDDVDKEEEELFCILEKEKEKEDLEEALHPEDKPKAAPALIQAGIKAGEVKDENDDAVKVGDSEAKDEEKAGIVQVRILVDCWSLPDTILFCLFII